MNGKQVNPETHGNAAESLVRAAERLRAQVDAIPLCGADILRKGFGPLEYVCNPLDYAWEPYRAYLEKYGPGEGRIAVLIGMNPGPWGMGQTGVPFGDPAMVRGWLGLDGIIRPLDRCHPDRPVRGFESQRREESGTTLWGWARDRFGTPERFFQRYFVTNYCPLLMFDARGKNVTPSDFRKGTAQYAALLEACDRHLLEVLRILRPRFAIGIGQFARDRAHAVVRAAKLPVEVGCITHPSPQTRGRWGPGGWGALVESELAAIGALEPATER